MAIKRITTNLIQDVSIGTIDIANNAITAAKITDGNITTAKLADLNVTAGKLAGTLDLTGKTITVATATTGDSDTSPASTAFVQQEIAALVDSSPSSLNTLNELAAALGDDASFSTTVTNSIALKAPLASPTFTGTAEIPNLTTGGQQGTDGQLLTSTGSGIAWEDAPAGGPTFKTFGTDSIMIGDTTTGTINNANKNVGLGVNVFSSLTTGDNNVAVGYDALSSLQSQGGNVAVGVGGTANVAVFATTGQFVTGVISATGNITGGNLQGTIGDILNVNSTNLTVTNISAPNPGNAVNIGAGGNK